ncbi:hypothetical protein [Alkalicoccobacillus porphyridii]|nr:hypothetical protein [Alkalicoccobacillus porphyridii]
MNVKELAKEKHREYIQQAKNERLANLAKRPFLWRQWLNGLFEKTLGR